MSTTSNEHAMAVQMANSLLKERDFLTARIAKLEDELETERLRLAACGTAALGYFNGCKDEYKSASLDDVLKLRADYQALVKGESDDAV
jgi:hypothetical protein